MSIIAKISASCVFLLIAFHAYASTRFMYDLAIGKETDWALFGAGHVYDVPRSNTDEITTALILATVACTGYWLIPGLLRYKLRAWQGSLVLCLSIILIHWMMCDGKVNFVQVIHWKFMGYCCIPVLFLALSAPLYLKENARKSV